MLNAKNPEVMTELANNSDLAALCSLDNFIKTGEYYIEYNGCPVFYDYSYNEFGVIKKHVIMSLNNQYICGAIATCRNPLPDKYLFAVRNAYVSGSFVADSPSVSFECICRLLNLKNEMQVGEAFGCGDIFIEDYSEDSYIHYKRGMKIPPGYTKIRNQLHRAASMVLRFRKKYYLLGFDEGSYFGVELPCKAITLYQAYECLIPKEARGKAWLRQGEWFAVPVKAPPEVGTILARDWVVLPLDHKGSNQHTVESSYGYLAIYKNEVYAKNFVVTHDDHDNLAPEDNSKWYKFVHNTAVRSVSVEDVD